LGQYSIRINDQYRICFIFRDGDFYEVEVTDYHQEDVDMVKMIETPKISEILYEEFMEPFGLSAYKLAKEIDVPVSRIQDILHDRRKITVDTSIRLGKFFGLSEKYFISLQNDIDARIEMADSYAKISLFVINPKPVI